MEPEERICSTGATGEEKSRVSLQEESISPVHQRRLRSASDGGYGPPQEEEDSGRAGVTTGGVAMAVLPAERSERTRLWLRPHRREMGSDCRALLRGEGERRPVEGRVGFE